MDCRYIRGKLTGFLDGDLREAEAREVSLHLDRCASCREDLVEQRTLVDRCQGVLEYTGPAYSFQALRKRMNGKEALEEVVLLLPKLKIYGAIPRFAVAMLLLVLLGQSPFAIRHSRQVYAAVKEPFAERAKQFEESEAYFDRMDAAYRAQFTEDRPGEENRKV